MNQKCSRFGDQPGEWKGWPVGSRKASPAALAESVAASVGPEVASVASHGSASA